MSSWEEDRIDELWDEIGYFNRKIDGLEDENVKLRKENSNLRTKKEEYKTMDGEIDKAIEKLKVGHKSIDSSLGDYKKGYSSETAKKKNKMFSNAMTDTDNIVKELKQIKEQSAADVRMINGKIRKNDDTIRCNDRKIQGYKDSIKMNRNEIRDLES